MIGVFKLAKAAMLIALGVVLVSHTHHAIAQRVVRWSALAPTTPSRLRIDDWAERFQNMPASHAHWLTAGAFAYAVLFLVEGIGLLARKRWAEWFTIVVTASFMPVEIYEIVRHVRVGPIAALVINLAVLAYLVVRRLHDRSHRARVRLDRALAH